MTVYEKIEKIIDIVLNVYPMAKLFKNKIMKKAKEIPESTLRRVISEIKNVLGEE